MFKRLGKILYSIWSKEDYIGALGEFIQDFVDQTAFMQYFKECWVPKLGRMLNISLDRYIYIYIYVICMYL